MSLATTIERVLITGGTGLLGKALLETAPNGWEVFATSHRNSPPEIWKDRFSSLDVLDETAVERLGRELRPQLVIHTASIGSVDEAEREPERVAEVNVGGTQAVGRMCAHVGALLVFVSSNAVFDGSQPPYPEEAPVRSVNRYGAIKIAAEAWVRASGLAHVIIRPILMYGWPCPGGRGNVVTRWLDRLERGHPVEVDEEIVAQPLLAANCAQGIWSAVAGPRSGTFHLAGADRLSLVEFARETARVFGCDERLVTPASCDRLARFAPRPRDTSFVTTRMEHELGVRPLGVQEGLTLMQQARACVG